MKIVITVPFTGEKAVFNQQRDFLSDSKIIAIDFDGVIKSGNNFRDMSTDLMPGCKPALKFLYEEGFDFILWTSRCDDLLDEADKYLQEHGIRQYFSKLNEPSDTVNFKQGGKIFANYYVDDLASTGFEGWYLFIARVMEDYGYVEDNKVGPEEEKVLQEILKEERAAQT